MTVFSPRFVQSCVSLFSPFDPGFIDCLVRRLGKLSFQVPFNSEIRESHFSSSLISVVALSPREVVGGSGKSMLSEPQLAHL